jgi:hypothetical protein
MGATISNISHRITVQYIETAKYVLNHNNTRYPLLVDVDKISEFLYEETQWSISEFVEIDDIYWDFMKWLKRKYKTNKYNKKIFIDKLSKKRTIINNKVHHIKMANMSNMINSDIFRL